MGRGVSGFAEVISQIQVAEGVSQFATSRSQSNKEIQALGLRLRQNNDTSTYPAELQTSLQTIEGFRPKSAAGSQRFDEFLSQSIPQWESGVALSAFNKTKDIAEGAYISNLSSAIVSGDLDTAIQVISEAKDTGVITNEQAAKDLLNAPNRIIESQVKTILNNASELMSAGDFAKAQIEIAKAELIINDPDAKIDPKVEAVLRSRINTSKKAIEAKQKDIQNQKINEVTSQTIGEFFKGTLTEPELFRRHDAGLVKDSEFKSMIKALQNPSPAVTDPVAAGNIRRAKVDFDMGVINRAEADSIALTNSTKLTATDRAKVFVDLEDVEAKIIAASKSNAYSEGRSLMSRAFADVGKEGLLAELEKLTQLSGEEKDKINRRFVAEVSNRDLYERAVDDRFKEIRQEKISDISKYQSESLRILLQYQRRGRLGLEALEEEVVREQRRILDQPIELTAPEIALQRQEDIGLIEVQRTIKPIDEMTTEEKQRELARIRELRRLTK